MQVFPIGTELAEQHGRTNEVGMRAGNVTQSQGTALIPGDLINRKQDYRANRREIIRPYRSASHYLPACPPSLHNASWWALRSAPFLDSELSPSCESSGAAA